MVFEEVIIYIAAVLRAYPSLFLGYLLQGVVAVDIAAYIVRPGRMAAFRGLLLQFIA